MAVYAVIEIEVTDREMYARYSQAVPGIVSRYGGRYLANTEEIIPLAGGWQPQKIVLLEFDTMQQLRECFGSMKYQAIAPLREQSTRGKAVVVRGCKSEE